MSKFQGLYPVVGKKFFGNFLGQCFLWIPHQKLRTERDIHNWKFPGIYISSKNIKQYLGC